jgi:hypothetical protein
MSDTKETNPKDGIGAKKVPMTVVPFGVLSELAVAMLEGATKYGRHNYRVSGARSSIYIDAAMRHLMRWWEGEDIDPDSGVSHIVKAIASLTVLRDAQLNDKAVDDRPPRHADIGAHYDKLNRDCEHVLKIYAHVNPKHFTLEDTDGAKREDTGVSAGEGKSEPKGLPMSREEVNHWLRSRYVVCGGPSPERDYQAAGEGPVPR